MKSKQLLSERNFLMSMQTDKNAVEFRKLALHLKEKGLCTTVGVQLHQIQAAAGFNNPETMAGWAQLTNHIKWFKDNGFKMLNSSYKCNGIHINNLFKFFVWCEVSKSFTRSII